MGTENSPAILTTVHSNAAEVRVIPEPLSDGPLPPKPRPLQTLSFALPVSLMGGETEQHDFAA
jgi:hypothetical protein